VPPVQETILLFGLSQRETRLVRRLTSSFVLDIVALTIGTVRGYLQNYREQRICLIIIHIDPQHPSQHRVVQLIRDFVGPFPPILVLVPQEKHGEIRKYLSAGADDFMELPLNENRFSVAFLILLEMGQAAMRPPHRSFEESQNEQNKDVWDRVLRYFAPKSLLENRAGDWISNRWQQVRRLGVGGFGVVWLVQEAGTNRLAVAKTPHSPLMNIRVLRSAAILKRLVHHPNVVQLIEVVRDTGIFILIQEYAEGPTLQQMIEKGISSLEKESCMAQLLSVISYAHKHKILHRDIKPENMIITASGRLKLLDFGIARDLSWQKPGGGSEGTVNFMPPEQFAGKSCIASDVWALGVILYIFATNAVPYLQQNDHYPQNIAAAVQSRAPHTINPEIDPELERIIMRCLEVDLDRRYQDATELLKDMRTSFPQFGTGKLLSP
jgi:CheY-like chemotaxis protein